MPPNQHKTREVISKITRVVRPGLKFPPCKTRTCTVCYENKES